MFTAHLPLPASRKLGQRWVGLFGFFTRVDKVAYRLELPEQMAIYPVFYVSLLKPYDSIGDLFCQQPPEPTLMAGQKEFEVACILHNIRQGRGFQYLVE